MIAAHIDPKGGNHNEKDLIFAPALFVIGILLFLFRSTGITGHIVLSVAGILLLIAYTAATKKNWKIPALEILMRACYGIALVSGIVIMNVHGIAALAVIHQVCAVLFMALILVLFTHKAIANKKA
jgi:hypothetical protein